MKLKTSLLGLVVIAATALPACRMRGGGVLHQSAVPSETLIAHSDGDESELDDYLRSLELIEAEQTNDDDF